MKKGDLVWFVDGGHKNGEFYWYAESGTLKSVKRNGTYLIDAYFGDFELPKDRVFASREDCEKFLLEGKKCNYM